MTNTQHSAVALKGLRKVYSGGFEALKSVDLNVEKGDFFALLGPNGAGKSTLIGIVSTLVRKTDGTVQIFGHDLDSDTFAAKRELGVVPQEFNFNNFETPLQIVTNQAGYYGVGYAEAKSRAEQLLRRLDLWGKRKEQARMLSGGMRRRLMIARALVHQPKLLILDEPTAGVDIELRRGLWDFLRELNAAGTTIILTTHYLEEAEQLCRNIAIIDDGKIIEQANTQQLLRTLDRQTYVLDLASKPAELPQLPHYEIRAVGDSCERIELDVLQTQTISDAIEQLNQQGLVITALSNKANRLEELFLRRTAEKEKSS